MNDGPFTQAINSDKTDVIKEEYIVYRKRKIFYGKSKFHELIDIIQKHRDEKFLVPLSEPTS